MSLSQCDWAPGLCPLSVVPRGHTAGLSQVTENWALRSLNCALFDSLQRTLADPWCGWIPMKCSGARPTLREGHKAGVSGGLTCGAHQGPGDSGRTGFVRAKTMSLGVIAGFPRLPCQGPGLRSSRGARYRAGLLWVLLHCLHQACGCDDGRLGTWSL